MSRYMQPFVIKMPQSRPQRRRVYYQQPTLEQEFVDILGDLVSRRRPESETGHCCPPGRCTRCEDSAYQPFWCDFIRANQRRPWVHVLNFSGFQTGDISVKVEGGKMLVHARREENEGANTDLMERMREVNLPQNIDAEKIACFLAEDGRFVIKAPYVDKKRLAEKQQQEVKTESKYVAPQEADEVPIHCEQTAGGASLNLGDSASSKESQEKPRQRPPTASLADFIVSALTGDFPGQSSPRRSSPVPGEDYVMLNANGGEQRDLAPLGDSTDVIEEDGKKMYCVKVQLPNYPPENIKVRCHGRNMYVDAKHEIEDSGIYQCHEFHRRYIMPENAADEAAKAQIDDSGVVTVKVPLLEEPVPESRDIPVEQTGQKSEEPKPECENKDMCKDDCKTECNEGAGDGKTEGQ